MPLTQDLHKVGGLDAKSCPSFVTPWTVASQAPLSMGFIRQRHLSGFPFPSQGDLPDPGIKLRSPALQPNSLPTEPPEKPVSPLSFCFIISEMKTIMPSWVCYDY